MIYDQLHKLASRSLQREAPSHTLQPTALVHEVYLRLAENDRQAYADEQHLFAIAAGTMRRVLIDHARGRQTDKRGGGIRAASLTFDVEADQSPPADLVAVDDVLSRLAAKDSRKSAVVEMHVFGGFTIPEVADALGVSISTVETEWRLAKAWLSKNLLDRGFRNER